MAPPLEPFGIAVMPRDLFPQLARFLAESPFALCNFAASASWVRTWLFCANPEPLVRGTKRLLATFCLEYGSFYVSPVLKRHYSYGKTLARVPIKTCAEVLKMVEGLRRCMDRARFDVTIDWREGFNRSSPAPDSGLVRRSVEFLQVLVDSFCDARIVSLRVAHGLHASWDTVGGRPLVFPQFRAVRDLTVAYWRRPLDFSHGLGSVRNLVLRSCDGALHLPSSTKTTATNLETALVAECPRLDILDAFNSCVCVVLEVCPGVVDLEPLRNAREVVISECLRVQDVSPLANVKYVAIERCQNVQDVSPLSRVGWLRIRQCSGVVSVAALGSVRSLGIEMCDNVADFSPLCTVQALELAACKKLRDATVLAAVPRLCIKRCENLQRASVDAIATDALSRKGDPCALFVLDCGPVQGRIPDVLLAWDPQARRVAPAQRPSRDRIL